MANTVIQLKHSTLIGNVPSSLANGEISINSRDGKFFYSTPAGVIVTHFPFSGPAGLNQEIQFNDSGVLGSDSGLTYNKTTDVITVVGGAIVGGVNVTPQIQLAFTLANTPSHVANSAFLRANNSVNANTGGSITGDISITGNLTVDTNTLYVDAVNNEVGIGTTTPGYKLEVNGSFAATTKSFVILHPTKDGMKLRYGSLEGPENGVYIRGRTKQNIIELPEYWTKLVDSESITVNLTPIENHQNLFVEKIKDNKICIKSNNVLNRSIDCFYIVFAERIDVDKLKVEI